MQTIGGYEVLDELARGGMGVVYRGRDPRNGGLVAIKLILAGREAGDASLRRFEREAAALSRVRHTNVLAIHGSGFERGAPYLVTDLLTGGTLQERINRQGPLPPTEAAALTAAIARGVALVHANGILHRDLKPENVLLRPGGEPCLADFGLVSELDPARSRLTATGSLLGTPSFMSPEQAKGDWSGLGPHSDVYGLGAILYTALTGAPPASGASLTDILLCAIDTAPPSPSSFGRP
ncbi:MAG: serine/threonine protein kinase, partial [Planctomycetes bacterium]|nr:serine/threonine protein kinase [Planctomycetota bacterium]